MAEPPAKHARIQRLRDRLPFMSQSALGAIMQIAASEPLPEGNRKDVRIARDQRAQTPTPYGPVHQFIEVPALQGSPVRLEVQTPAAMLRACCEVSPPLRAFLGTTAATCTPTPAEPWRLILYMDEILPGNQLAYTHSRKMWGVYWSCLDWGSAALANEDFFTGARGEGRENKSMASGRKLFETNSARQKP